RRSFEQAAHGPGIDDGSGGIRSGAAGACTRSVFQMVDRRTGDLPAAADRAVSADLFGHRQLPAHHDDGGGYLLCRAGELCTALQGRAPVGIAAAHRDRHGHRPAARAGLRPADGPAVPRAAARTADLRVVAGAADCDLADRGGRHLAPAVRQPLRPHQPDPWLDRRQAGGGAVDRQSRSRLSRHHPVRDLAVDTLHVPDPAGGSLQRRQVADRGGGDRRRRLLARLLQDRAAGDLAGDGHRAADPRPRSRAHLRYHLGAHERRPRHDDGDDLDLHLHPGLPAVRGQLYRRHGFSGHPAPDGHRDLAAAPDGIGEMSAAPPLLRRPGVVLALRYATAVALTLFFVFPIYWLFIISFKTPDEIFHFPPVWYPKSIQFANYRVLFKDGDAITVWNSLVLAGVSTVIAMLLGTMAAYSLVRFKTGGENLAVWIISQRMMPPIAIVFPIFLLYVFFGWVDTFHGLIILYTAFSLP